MSNEIGKGMCKQGTHVVVVVVVVNVTTLSVDEMQLNGDY
jgi:hypothetical protein